MPIRSRSIRAKLWPTSGRLTIPQFFRPAEIPESATYIGNFATSDAQRQLLDVLDGGDEVGRPFIMSETGAGSSN